MAKRLWDKGEELNKHVHEFTVGDDPVVDLELIQSDLIGSAAHAKMLASVGLLSKDECGKLLLALKEILHLHDAKKFEIPNELEDCHTAIETFLTNEVGEAGRKIHTGRSRNDQVMLAMRLYLRERLTFLVGEVLTTSELFLTRANELGHQPMPGYTHFQPAMPASLAMWLHAFAETLLELAREGFSLLETIDSNPLGAASGFGASLPLDRELTAKLLHFSRVQRNPITVQNSRGQFELKALRWAVDIAGVMEKFAFDMILYTTREYGFFNLPGALTTGSSIMPQKHNPDVLELLRGRAAKVRGAENELSWVLAKLPSNYHRDFQYTKEPLVRGLRHVAQSLPMIREVVSSFTVNKDRLEAAMTPDLYATYEVYREVKRGAAFRDSYRNTAEKVKNSSLTRAELEVDFQEIAAANDKERQQAAVDLQAFQTKQKALANSLAELGLSAFSPEK